MKTYCPDCGQATEYVGKKPNFCQGCGFNFITMSNATITQKKPKQRDEDPLEPGDEDVRQIHPSVYEMKGLDVSINVEKPNSVKMDELFPIKPPSPQEEGTNETENG